MTQNIIKVEDQNGILVVDSRLIAERLGIMHKSFMETVLKFQSRVEKRFGQLWFKTETVKNSVGAVNEVKFVLLTKPQAEVYMTFSRNTDQVVDCKLDLVQAFNEAEKTRQNPFALKDEIDVLSQCLSIAGLDPRLVAGVALNHAGVRMPQLKGAIAESHQLLAATGQNELLLTPTNVGKELGVSGRKVNEILTGLGYQVKNTGKKSKTEPDYLVTDAGKPYAGNTIATGKLYGSGADNTTYQHLKWKESVIDVIRQHLNLAA